MFGSCSRTSLVPLLFAGVLAGCPNNTRDSHCTPDETDPETTDCIYAGDGEGPIVAEPACALEGEVPVVCPSFEQVHAIFVDPAKGNCSSSGCHGIEATAQDLIFLPGDDIDEFYDALLAVSGSVGRPYVVADDPSTGDNEALSSWLACNIEGKVGGGFPMPPPSGLLGPTDLETVKGWLLCGAQPAPTCDPAGGDGPCVACAKASCCGLVQQCLDDADCAACVACVQTNGGLDACAMECSADNAFVAGLSGCLADACGEECPQ